MTCTAGARQVDSIVPQRPRCSIVFYGQDCALKYGSPGQSPGMTIKKESPGMTCTAGARQVDSIVLQRPRCSGGVCEGLCALKFMSFSGLTRESTCTAGARQVDSTVPQRPRCSIVFHGQDCALKYGSPGRCPGMTRKNKMPGDDIKKS